MGTLLFKSLIGSQITNLATPDSDKDYVGFLIPTWEDLYNKVDVTEKQSFSVAEDFMRYDIRRLPKLAQKPTITTLSIFYTNEMTFYPTGTYSKDVALKALTEEIFLLRHDIADSYPAKLFEACMGMFRADLATYKKDPSRLKAAANAYRDVDFLLRYAKWKDAGLALRYEDSEMGRHMILSMKQGAYTYEEIIEMLNRMAQFAVDKRDFYYSLPETDLAVQKVDEIVKEIIHITSR